MKPLDVDAFAPFDQVISRPARAGDRASYEAGLSSHRPQATVRLWVNHVRPTTLPLLATKLERHRYSSQTFLPLSVSRYIVITAPSLASGAPDVAGIVGFVAEGTQGITYAADVWHHPICTLDEPASFAVLMWQDDSPSDEEWATLPDPILFDM
ncbi:MAG: ureidoglycolate lyase [Alphaproteobacteria bacterium]|nr:ureidoglycolate lyase [Alphaproteobacteria bacterium]MCZ6608443.1 ureidoglycolate lyase [Alphaproteobacteria bacterium]